MTRRPAVAPDPAALARSEHDSLAVAPGRLRAALHKVVFWRYWLGYRKRPK